MHIFFGSQFQQAAEMDVRHHSQGCGHDRSLVLTKQQKNFIAPEVLKQRLELQACHRELLGEVVQGGL